MTDESRVLDDVALRTLTAADADAAALAKQVGSQAAWAAMEAMRLAARPDATAGAVDIFKDLLQDLLNTRTH